MGESPRETDPVVPPAVVAEREEMSDEERAVAAVKAVRQVEATLEATSTRD